MYTHSTGSKNEVTKILVIITSLIYTVVLMYSKIMNYPLFPYEKAGIIGIVTLSALVYFVCMLKKSPTSKGWAGCIVVYCILFASVFLIVKLQPVYVPIVLPAAVIAVLYHPYSGIAFHFLYCISYYYIGQPDKKESIIFYLIFGIIVCFSSEFMKTMRDIFFTFVIITAAYFSLIIIWMFTNYGTIDYFGLIPGIIPLFLTFTAMFVALIVSKYMVIKKRTSKQKYMALCSEDFPPIAEMRDTSLRVFYHTLEVADLSAAAAMAIGADDMLCRTGAMYHDIGKTISRDYVPAGVLIAKEYKIPKDVIAIIEEHNGKKRLPQTKEAAIVLLADTLVSTKDYMLKPNMNKINQKKIIDSVMSMRMEGGLLDDVGFSLKEYSTIKETFVEILCGTIRDKSIRNGEEYDT